MTILTSHPPNLTIDDLLDEVRAQIEADPDVLAEARTRLQLTRDAASSFYGSLRTYRSGSLAAHTMNRPVTDGDGGLVLNRNYYPTLGPDGHDESPVDVAEALRNHIRPIIRETYPNASIHMSKRGPEVHFGDPFSSGEDPTVDMVVAMSRKEGAGIWIPNLETGKWEASDPEGHIDLFNSGGSGFRSTRRKIMRLAKAWNKQFATPGASSFMICVWAYEFVESGMGVAKGLTALFAGAAARLEAGEPTKDAAGVSKNLKLNPAVASADMANRLRRAEEWMNKALQAETEDELREAMSIVFNKYVDYDGTNAIKASARLLASGKPVAAAAIGVAVSGSTVPKMRSYGGRDA
jgi:hypothetical protein